MTSKMWDFLTAALWLAVIILACCLGAQAQTATDFSITVPNFGTSSIQLLGAVDSGTLSYDTAVGSCGTCTNVAHGTLSQFNSATGTILYSPTSGFTGTDTFTYKAIKNGSTTATGTVTITVSPTKTTVIGPVIKPDGSFYAGEISFTLTERARTADGLLPKGAVVKATLSSGNFSVSLYPTTTANGPNSTTMVNNGGAKAYYQVWVKETNGTQNDLGVYDIPAIPAGTTIALNSLSPITSAQGSTLSFVSQAAFNAFLSRSYAVQVLNGGSVIGTRGAINFIQGANMGFTITDDPGNNRINLQIDGPSGSGGGTIASGTIGRLCQYTGTTSCGALTLLTTAGALVGVNDTTNGHRYITFANGTGMNINYASGVYTFNTIALTNLNGLTGATQSFAYSSGTCGSDFSIASSGTTHTFCQPYASTSAAGTIRADDVPQSIKGPKTVTASSSSSYVPLTVKQGSGGADTIFRVWNSSSADLALVAMAPGSNIGSGLSATSLTAGNLRSIGTNPLFINHQFATGLGGFAVGWVAGFTNTSSNTVSESYGLVGNWGTSGGANHSGNQIGVLGYYSHDGTGAIGQGVGVLGDVLNVGTGSQTASANFLARTTVSAGTLNAHAGLHVLTPTISGGGSIVNFKAIEIDALAGTTPMAIYTHGIETISFGGEVRLRQGVSPALAGGSEAAIYYDGTDVRVGRAGGAYGYWPIMIQATASLDFPSTSAQSFQDLTLTVTGAIAGKPCYLGATATAMTNGTSFVCFVSAADTVTVRHINQKSSAVDPASQFFTVVVYK